MHNNSRTKKTKPGPDQIPQAYLRWALKAAKRFQQLYPHFPRTKPGQSFTTGVRPFGTLFALAASLILSACTVPRPQRGGKAITAGGITQTLTQGDKALITELRSSPLSSLPSPVLFQRIQFAVDANPIAKIAHALYSGGFLKAVSVGFIPIKWEDGTPKTPFRRKYTQQELLEVSAVFYVGAYLLQDST